MITQPVQFYCLTPHSHRTLYTVYNIDTVSHTVSLLYRHSVVFAGSGFPRRRFRWERLPWEEFSLGAASLGGVFAGSGFPRRSFRWERPPWEKFSLGAASLGRVFAGSGLPGKSFRWERPPWEKFSLGAASLGKVFAEEAKMAWLGCYGRANIAADSLGANDMSLDLLYTVHDLARKHTVSTFTVCISLYKHE
jgi:hypothetical protein